jgi:predicted nucleotidyltransferase
MSRREHGSEMKSGAAASIARQLAERYGTMPAVRAVALGGSRASDLADEESDIDLYVYANKPLPVAMRASLIANLSRAEIDNRFWEIGDEWVDPDSGFAIDVTFRSPRWVQDELDRVLVRHQASTGYTTAVWHNVRTSQPLVDPGGWYSTLLSEALVPYPEELRRAVVAKNQPILAAARGAYRRQIAKALTRGDRVSVNHRVTALLESVFDIIFAVNRQTHPGEKRQLEWVRSTCPVRPPRFAEDIESVLSAITDGPRSLLASVDYLVIGVDEMLGGQHLLPASNVSFHHLTTS